MEEVRPQLLGRAANIMPFYRRSKAGGGFAAAPRHCGGHMLGRRGCQPCKRFGIFLAVLTPDWVTELAVTGSCREFKPWIEYKISFSG